MSVELSSEIALKSKFVIILIEKKIKVRIDNIIDKFPISICVWYINTQQPIIFQIIVEVIFGRKASEFFFPKYNNKQQQQK